MPRISGAPLMVRQTTLEVSRRCLKQNFHALLKSAAGKDLLVVLKSNAYGHSLVDVAKLLAAESKGLHGIGLANVEEAALLREAGVKSKIYILSGIHEWNAKMDALVRRLRVVPVISSLRTLQALDQGLRKSRKPLEFHLKLNTGMNRLGVDMQELGDAFELVRENPLLRMQGLMSHFAVAEEKTAALTKSQVRCFELAAARAEAIFGRMPLLHLENSAGLQNKLFADAAFARVGINLFGMGNPRMQAVARWTAQIYQTRSLEKGASVGYGRNFRAKRAMKMAVLGVGYGDGYARSFSNKAWVLIRGRRCPVIGAVSMDLTAVDISACPEVDPSRDRAVLLGRDGKERIRAEDLAELTQTISWEITTRITARVPRVLVQ